MVNLAAVSNRSLYVDCDVEEPNGHLYIKPLKQKEEEVSISIPKVDKNLCSGCQKCVDFCKFNALAYIKDRLVIFEEICHSCGGCIIVCPESALTVRKKVIGKITSGQKDHISIVSGILNIGEASAVPIIKKMLEGINLQSDIPVFIDCPPGSACIVMESIKDADYCVLVAEPTIFGVHNLNMVVKLVKWFKKPFGVILNKSQENNVARKFCVDNKLKIIGEIPYDKELGEINSNGMIASLINEKYKNLFTKIYDIVLREASNETITNS